MNYIIIIITLTFGPLFSASSGILIDVEAYTVQVRDRQQLDSYLDQIDIASLRGIDRNSF